MLWPVLDRVLYGNPWREMGQMQNELDRLFDPTLRYGNREYPALDIRTNGEAVVVTAELPGVAVEDIDISVSGDTLTVRGSRKPEELKEGEVYHRHERGHGEFIRTLRLPFTIDADKVEARLEKGVLHLTVPRTEEEKPKKIEVKAG